MEYATNLRFQPSEDDPAYLRVREEDALRLNQTPLFVQMVGGTFVQYKPAGRRLTSSLRGPADLPRRLYIRKDDKELAVQDIQVALLDGTIQGMIRSGDQDQVKLLVVSLLEEALREPRIACLAGFKGLVNTLVQEYSQDERMLKAFYMVAGEGYSLAEHSMNVMALVMGYGIRKKWRARIPSSWPWRPCCTTWARPICRPPCASPPTCSARPSSPSTASTPSAA